MSQSQKHEIIDTNPRTLLPSISIVLPSIQAFLTKHWAMGVIYVDLSKYHVFEEIYGSDKLDEWLSCCAKNLMQSIRLFPDLHWIVCERADHDDFILVCFSQTNEDPLTEERLINITAVIQEDIQKKMATDYSMFSPFIFYLGYHFLVVNPKLRIERQVFRAIKQASLLASDRQLVREAQLIRQMSHILKEEKLHTVYQPILDLNLLTITGYEALTRGPLNTDLENPTVLLDLASKGNMLYDFEVTAKKSALKILTQMHSGQKLFLNLDTTVIEDDIKIEKFLEKTQLKPGNIVFEITERSAIKDFKSFTQLVKNLKALGYFIAVDDAGHGYSSMEAIAYLEPEYIKIDISIIREIQKNRIKRDIVLSLQKIADKLGAVLIAEGIETAEEYEAIRDLGVSHGQGFYFAKPIEILIHNVNYFQNKVL